MRSGSPTRCSRRRSTTMRTQRLSPADPARRPARQGSSLPLSGRPHHSSSFVPSRTSAEWGSSKGGEPHGAAAQLDTVLRGPGEEEGAAVGDDNKTVVRRFAEERWGRGSLHVADELVAEHVTRNGE